MTAGPVVLGMLHALLLLTLVGCQASSTPAKDAPRPRVVSFSPAITDILFALDAGEHVVGVTPFCLLPAGEQRPPLGDAKGIQAEAILAADPQLVLTQSAPRRLEGLKDLNSSIDVVLLEIETLSDIRRAVVRIGELLEIPQRAAELARRFDARLVAVSAAVAGRDRPRVVFVMGTDRPFVAGRGSFVDELIGVAGGVNAMAEPVGGSQSADGPNPRWRAETIETIAAARPDVIVCQVGPAQVDAARAYWQQWPVLPAATAGRVHAVSDPRWTIPSTHLADKAGQLAQWLHPGVEIPERRP
jgi:iron complex transport system substrate-binding protein